MASPGATRLLFQSPSTSAGESDLLPPLALISTDTAPKAEQYRCVSPSWGLQRAPSPNAAGQRPASSSGDDLGCSASTQPLYLFVLTSVVLRPAFCAWGEQEDTAHRHAH